MKNQRAAFVAGIAIMSLCGCGGQSDDGVVYDANALLDSAISETVTVPEGEAVPVPSDPRASYRLVSWSRMENGNLEALTRRDGPSGTSFARREIDCDAMTFRYLGEGDTLAEAEADSPNLGEMSALLPGSISTEVSEFVCRRARV
ncbi:MAG: hypothetical protein KF780_04745 [Sphingomonas sp.]|nr:hypothetical protein [Sphingomonas sp.]